ncbi:hypothetical protein HanIR_Chr12g0609751 [Helianthus annuus]|nr:hypothetical protein HanIR_Chr12g0609751 [Helianthus annuus]
MESATNQTIGKHGCRSVTTTPHLFDVRQSCQIGDGSPFGKGRSVCGEWGPCHL